MSKSHGQKGLTYQEKKSKEDEGSEIYSTYFLRLEICVLISKMKDKDQHAARAKLYMYSCFDLGAGYT